MLPSTRPDLRLMETVKDFNEHIPTREEMRQVGFAIDLRAIVANRKPAP